MIEYYTLMHKGADKLYRDDFHLNFGKTITVLLLYVSKNEEVILDTNLANKLRAFINSCNDMEFDALKFEIDNLITNQCDYLLLQINDNSITVERHGNCYAHIVKNGELKTLTNGMLSLENDDHIICGTKAFFKYLNTTAILSDSLTSISSENWMDSLCFRIAEQGGFSEGNMTAVTFIVRKD